MQDLLVDPPDGIDEDVLGVAAVRVAAAPDHVERGLVGTEQRLPPRLRGDVERPDRVRRVAAVAVALTGHGVAADRVVGAQRQHLADVAEPPRDGRERRRVGMPRFRRVAAPLPRAAQDVRAWSRSVLTTADRPARHGFPEVFLIRHEGGPDRGTRAAVDLGPCHPVEQPQTGPVVLLEQWHESPWSSHGPIVSVLRHLTRTLPCQRCAPSQDQCGTGRSAGMSVSWGWDSATSSTCDPI
jgi:hypothetical protein